MGFWHTGYFEFHEPTGLEGWPTGDNPPQYECVHCDKTFTTISELRSHRFETHHFQRPVLFVHGKELGNHPLRITRPLSVADVQIDQCDKAMLNGADVSISSLPHVLASKTSELCQIKLFNSRIESNYTLDICVASDFDIKGVEKCFLQTAKGNRLDTRAIEQFIIDTKEYVTAIGYCDGICSYLYGVLAKEKASDSTLPYEAYTDKFNRAVEQLSIYDRPLARIINGLVGFHFNQFQDVIALANGARVAQAAEKFKSWIHLISPEPSELEYIANTSKRIELLLTDLHTEKIIRWAVQAHQGLSAEITEMESLLHNDAAEYDRTKLRVILAMHYLQTGNRNQALGHVRAIRNIPPFGYWADSLIRKYSERNNEKI